MTFLFVEGGFGIVGIQNSGSFESVEIGIEMLVFVLACDLCEWKEVKKGWVTFFLFLFFLFCHMLVVVVVQLTSTTLYRSTW